MVDMKWIPLISGGPKANTTMGGQKDEWTKKDLKITPQNRSRRSTWEIDTGILGKSFGLSTPVRNTPLERKLRSVEEERVEKVKETNDTDTNLKVYNSTVGKP